MKYTDYTKQKFKVFACRANKSPATPNGFKDATDNEQDLQYQFHQDDFLIGLPTGLINNIAIVDFDLYKTAAEGRDIEEIKEDSKMEYPETLTVQSKNGGIHYYYRIDPNKNDIRCSTKIFKDPRYTDSQRAEFSKLAETDKEYRDKGMLPVDIRGSGGYTIAFDEKNYFALDCDDEILKTDFMSYVTDAPEWLYGHKKPDVIINQSSFDPLPDAEYREISSALKVIPSHDYDLWVRTGIALKNTNSPRGFELWDKWSEKSEKYEIDDQEKKWDSFKPTGDITIASIFDLAKKAGWTTTYKDVIEIDLDQVDERKNHEKAPFPKELLKPPGLIGELIDHIHKFSKKRQPILALAGALSAAGAIMGQRFQTDQGLRTNLYILGVGESGSGKEAARASIKRLFEESGIGEWAATEDLASDAAILSTMEKTPSQVFLLDEIGRFLKTTNQASSKNSHLYNVISVLLKIYGSANQTYRGKAYADLEKQKKIESPNLCIYGTTVPRTLFEGLTVENISDGFLSRFMIFESEDHNPAPTGRRRMATQTIDKDLINKVRAIIKTPVNIHIKGNVDTTVNPIVVKMEPVAEKMLDDYEIYVWEKRQELEKEDRINTTYNRAVQFAEQIALIIAVGRNHESPAIMESDVVYAISLVNYLSDRIHHIAEHFIARNEYEHEGKRILNLIRVAGKRGMTSSQLTRKTQNLKSFERNDLITTLLDSEMIMSAMDGRTRYYYPKKIEYKKENV